MFQFLYLTVFRIFCLGLIIRHTYFQISELNTNKSKLQCSKVRVLQIILLDFVIWIWLFFSKINQLKRLSKAKQFHMSEEEKKKRRKSKKVQWTEGFGENWKFKVDLDFYPPVFSLDKLELNV